MIPSETPGSPHLPGESDRVDDATYRQEQVQSDIDQATGAAKISAWARSSALVEPVSELVREWRRGECGRGERARGPGARAREMPGPRRGRGSGLDGTALGRGHGLRQFLEA